MLGRSDDAYLFIDGEYVRRRFAESMHYMFRCDTHDADINYQVLMAQARAKRAFYYDCIDDIRGQAESEADFQERVAAQESFVSRAGGIKGFHVRQGSLKGIGKKRRQKEIDVLLAVDMLTHGYDGNMGTAVLLAGDLDFRPVVEALVRAGVFVEVWYEPTSSAVELPGAGDYGRKLSFFDLYEWGSAPFKKNHPQPTFSDEHSSVKGYVSKRGQNNGREVLLIKDSNGPKSVLRMERSDGGVHWFGHDDAGVLERYVPLVHGPIDWQ